MKEFTEQELIRRQKAEDLRAKGIEPFGYRIELTSNSKEIKEKYMEMTKEELHEVEIPVTIAGRIMTKRGKGKVGFMHIQDKYGQIQIYIRKDEIGDFEYELFDKADIGDIVGIEGLVMKTNTGELSVKATKYHHIVKSLRPLPEKYHGLSDVEERYRRRYVDLIMNEEARKIAFARPKAIRAIQNLLDSEGYVEVETPILGTIQGGAAARPFITHHNALDIDMYLRIATELHLKRLIVGGMDAVYEIGRIFRNEGMDRNHNPEFTTIELYKAFSDMEGMMDTAERIIKKVLTEVRGELQFEYKGHMLDFEKPFARIHMCEAIKNECGVDFFKITDLEECKKLALEHGIEVENHFLYGHIVEAFFEKYCEDKIIQPTFIYGHPTDISPLSKRNRENPLFTDRFELFIVNTEYANAFTELNDPIDQRARFEAQVEEQRLGNDEASDMDEDFCEALEYGLPPTGGMGIGIDRLVMLATGVDTIREVILFPHMKNRE